MAAGRRLGAGKGLEFNVAQRGGAGQRRLGQGPGPAGVSVGPTACGLPWLLPWGQVGPDGARGRLYTVCFNLRVWTEPVRVEH